MDLLNDLNDAQRAAVEYIDGPSLVIAGAGSGKTRVLTYKIAYLLSQGMKPWSIMALTFTNKAAREMKERIGKLVGDDLAQHLYMGTFHSIFSRILRAEAEHIGFNNNITYHLPETHLVLMGTIGNLRHGSSTNATSRIIDDTLESLLIVRVGNETEIGDDILDFLTLIETQSTINTIWDALLSEFLLEASALGIGTIENGKLIVSAIILPLDALDILRHYQSLLLVAVGWLIQYLLSFIIFAEHLFLNLIAVMMNQTVSCLHDRLS